MLSQSFFKVVPIFFLKIVKLVFIIMTDKSSGLSRTVLSDQLGRQRRLTLKSQPPIHKMQPISLLLFFFYKILGFFSIQVYEI